MQRVPKMADAKLNSVNSQPIFKIFSLQIF